MSKKSISLGKSKEFYVVPGKSLFSLQDKDKIEMEGTAGQPFLKKLASHDRSHLIKKTVINQAGKEQLVWVNPNKLGRKRVFNLPSDDIGVELRQVIGQEIYGLGLDVFMYQNIDQWIVAEMSSGLKLSCIEKSKREAIQKVKEQIEFFGLDTLKVIIEDYVKGSGSVSDCLERK